jgi:hypothetical protein
MTVAFTPPAMWRAMMGLGGVLLLRDGKVIAAVVARLN